MIRIKKVVLLICLLWVVQDSAVAQNNSPIKMGLRFAPNISWLTPGTKNYESQKIAIGTTAGFVADFYFAERYAFSTGFDFAFLNGSLNYPDSVGSVTGKMVRKYNLIYLEIPTMIKMKTRPFGDFAFYGQIGFNPGIRISSKAKDEFSGNNGSAFSEKNDANDATSMMRASATLGFGLEYSLDLTSRLFFGLGYNNSLNNVLTDKNKISRLDEKAWLNFVELNLGILF
ncbi:MAG TPA: porin family protein, partial [Bacteroidales bacterium]|nr:porin family protein [Bacteroidales bacterium]